MSISPRRITLTRLESSNQGTFGCLQVSDGKYVEYFYTGELPDKDNKPNISCIPKGLYVCHYTHSPRLNKYTYELEAVNGRSSIRIHSANLMGDLDSGFKRQLNGCIAVGERLGILDNQKALLLSAPAVRRLENIMNHESFELEII